MSVHTTGDMGASRRNVLAHPSSQVHLLVDSMEATQWWRQHTVRGFISLLGSQAGLAIESSKNAAGERTYKIFK